MNRPPDRTPVAAGAALLLAALAFAPTGATALQQPPSEPQQPAATETYVRATVDQDGRLRIATAEGRNIEPEKDGEQVGFADPQISPDGRAVGWLAQYPNCCTSYPVPLKLVVLTASGTRTFTGNGLPIWRWSFQEAGTLVAFRQETVHFGGNPHYELREIASGRLVAEYDPPVDRDNRPLPDADPPRWVADLDR